MSSRASLFETAISGPDLCKGAQFSLDQDIKSLIRILPAHFDLVFLPPGHQPPMPGSVVTLGGCPRIRSAEQIPAPAYLADRCAGLFLYQQPRIKIVGTAQPLSPL